MGEGRVFKPLFCNRCSKQECHNSDVSVELLGNFAVPLETSMGVPASCKEVAPFHLLNES